MNQLVTTLNLAAPDDFYESQKIWFATEEVKLAYWATYRAWTEDHKLRHPVFRGIRTDKAPEEATGDA